MASPGTAGEDYTERLQRKGTVWWKRALDVQRPYRWNLRRLQPGFTLDLGCGLGRNLAHLDGKGVGIDLRVEKQFSFPFPSTAVGKVFTYNEFVLVARTP